MGCGSLLRGGVRHSVLTKWLEDDDESDLNFECESAWSPPLELLHKIIEKYDLKYATCRWWEEGGYTGWDVVDLEDGIHSITN